MLRKADRTLMNVTLAQGFDILLGAINVTLPADTIPASDYSIVLFGDSGKSRNVLAFRGVVLIGHLSR